MGGTPNEAGPLGRWQMRQPVLLVFAPAPESPEYAEQALRIEAEKEGFLRRDLVLLELFTEGESRSAGEPMNAVDVDVLHKEFGIGPDDFCVVLIGRDGDERVRWRGAPVPMEEVYRWVDAVG